jgi:hypothetical protein
MKLISTSFNGDFELIDQQKSLASLEHPSWFSRKASLRISYHTLDIVPKHLFSSSFDIMKNQTNYAVLTMRWKGQVEIKFLQKPDSSTFYTLKPKGLFNRRYELYDQNADVQFVLLPKTNWKKLRQDFQIDLHPELKVDLPLVELISLSGYSAHLIKKRNAAAAT